MVHFLKTTKLFETQEGKKRLAEQLGFILLRYQQCKSHKDLIKTILIDVLSRCVDRAQRQLSTAVIKTALLTTTSHSLRNNQVAGLLVDLYKEFIIDQVSITASDFSKESVEDALYLRYAFSSFLGLQSQGKLKYKFTTCVQASQRSHLLVEICYQFGVYDNFILFIREHEEMIDVLVAQTLPWYQLRIDRIHASLNELSEQIDCENFPRILDDFLHVNGFSPMIFDNKDSFHYYEHVNLQLKMDCQLPVLVVLKTLQEADYLDEGVYEYCPELKSIKTWYDLYLLAQERIPWLVEPSSNDILDTISS